MEINNLNYININTYKYNNNNIFIIIIKLFIINYVFYN